MIKFLRRHWRAVCVSAVLIVLLAAAGLIVYGAGEIASPQRRELLEYHREFLFHPSAHGFRLDRFTASDGTPCLVCTPDPAPTFGKRGTEIRRQLAARGIELEPFGNVVGTLVLLHGRNGRKEDFLPVAERFCAAGFRCVIPDLPAHGDNPAHIATYGIREAGLPAEILKEAADRFSFDPQPAGLMGQSMGGSVGVHSAALPGAPWRALAVISSFDSLAPVIENKTAGYVGSTLAPAFSNAIAAVYRWKSGVPFSDIQPARHAATILIPTLIAQGTADRTIPLPAARRLYQSLPATTEKLWLEIPGADHDNIFITEFPIYASIAEWMLHHVAGK